MVGKMVLRWGRHLEKHWATRLVQVKEEEWAAESATTKELTRELAWALLLATMLAQSKAWPMGRLWVKQTAALLAL